MKRIPIDECPAGAWLDAVVGEALGWSRCPGENVDHWIPSGFDMPVVKTWSIDIRDAWELVEEIDLLDDKLLTKNEDGKYIICSFYSIGEWPDFHVGGDESAPLAICRAFLKAKGVKFVEVPE